MDKTELENHGGILLDCLEIICTSHQRKLSREAVLSGLPLEEGRLAPSSFARAAKRVGFTTRILERQPADLNPALLPAILLMTGNRACVVTGVDPANDQIRVIYPELGDSEVTQSLKELSVQASGSVIYARPEFEFDARAPILQKHDKDDWFWGVVRECRGLYRDVVVAALALGFFAIAMPLFVMNIYDRVVPNQAKETLWVLAIGVLIALTADLALRMVRAYFVELAASRIDVKVSSAILERVLSMQLKNRPAATGAFANNIQSFEAVRSFFSSFTLLALVDLPFVLLYLLVIALISPALILPILAGAVLLIGYTLTVHGRLEELSSQTMKAGSMRSAVLVEALNNLDDIKAFHCEHKTQASWENNSVFLARTNAQNRLLAASIGNAAMWVQQCVGVVIILIGVYAVFEGDLSQGGLIAAYLLSSRAMAPIGQSAAVLSQYHHASIAMESLNEIMAKPVERPPGKEWISHPALHGDIEFKNVWFKYDDKQPNALENISFKIAAGERVAILGRNGSGKTTMEKLMLGLYQPTAGSILLDGIELGQIDPAQLRHNIGYVPQNVSLFFGTLKENIALPTWCAHDEQVVQAAEIAGLMPLINQHPEGFSLQVGEQGRLLSGGQRQAVAIARAMINDPPLMLFDEPTASLDHNSEAKIIANLKEISVGKTLILVTHKTSLLELVDRIIIVDNGKILADGGKEQVLASLSKPAAQQAS